MYYTFFLPKKMRAKKQLHFIFVVSLLWSMPRPFFSLTYTYYIIQNPASVGKAASELHNLTRNYPNTLRFAYRANGVFTVLTHSMFSIKVTEFSHTSLSV